MVGKCAGISRDIKVDIGLLAIQGLFWLELMLNLHSSHSREGKVHRFCALFLIAGRTRLAAEAGIG